MLDRELSLVDLADLIQRKRGLQKRADYFQSVYQNMHVFGIDKADTVSVRFGTQGKAYAPNYKLTRSSDGSTRLVWGGYHKSVDDDFPNGWEETSLTTQAFSLKDVEIYRHG